MKRKLSESSKISGTKSGVRVPLRNTPIDNDTPRAMKGRKIESKQNSSAVAHDRADAAVDSLDNDHIERTVDEDGEDFNNHEFDESEDSDDGDDDDDDKDVEDDEEDEGALPRLLFLHAYQLHHNQDDCTVVITPTQLTSAVKALSKARALILDTNDTLNKILKASKSRGKDGKVAPGSSQVRRSLDDDRFMLCLINIELCKSHERTNDAIAAIECLREALLWFPRSIEANTKLALLTKVFSRTTNNIVEVETLLRKAVACTQLLKKQTFEETSAMASKYDDTDVLTAARLHQSELDLGSTTALEGLALLLAQLNRVDEADVFLRQGHFKWRLSQAVSTLVVCLCVWFR